jgi:hypothetical protein
MNSHDALNRSGLPLDFETEYTRVEQYDDHSCLFAAIATVAGVSAQDVRDVAVANGHIPSHGSFAIVDDGSLAAFLAGHHGWVASVWKEVATTYQLPDLAILLIDVTEKFPGRHVLFARQRNRGGQPNVEYIVDPGYWLEPSQQVRAAHDAELSWYIALHPMADSDY